MNKPKNLNPTSYQVVAYFTWGRKGPLTHPHKTVLGFFDFSVFCKLLFIFMPIVQTLWRQLSNTPTMDAKTRTPTATGNVFKNMYYENNHKNTEI